MKIYVAQIYPEAGIAYPFTHKCQKYLSERFSALTRPSSTYIDTYGSVFDLIFRMSAKSSLASPEVKGPTIFKRDKDVEYTIFLPFDRSRMLCAEQLPLALELFMDSAVLVLETLNIDTAAITEHKLEIIQSVLTDEQMVAWR